MMTFDTLEEKPFENIVEKEENAGNQHFLYFPQGFLKYQRKIEQFESLSNSCLQRLPIWARLKLCNLIPDNKRYDTCKCELLTTK